MTETIDSTIPTAKVYKDRAFWVGTFLGGPLVAGYLFAENFKALGQPEKVKPTWVIAIIVTIILFGGIFLVPENITIPNQIIPIVYTAITFALFKKIQEEKVEEYTNQGGVFYGWGKVIAVGIIGALITIVPIFSIAFLADSIEQANITTKTYGVAVKHEIDFDNTNISEKEVDEIAEAFFNTGFFDLSVAKYVYVVKNGSKYEISISVMEGMENDTEAIQFFRELRDQMDNYLPNNKIEIKLVVEYLDNVVKVLK
ncbi:hypothetical protein [Mangrovivirga cuniculi]|uniref:Uncharacterized protein n=1 Tax=Mangrovivirga cuniculi TaxID=2715131 RepID=A0A4D7JI13_9BACT|nr:hypothetical protein [Mangrovivirga cuniculi]QCK15639.1 hypothetical protein DCC35_13240 [Mangrovivirga cuniculi]